MDTMLTAKLLKRADTYGDLQDLMVRDLTSVAEFLKESGLTVYPQVCSGYGMVRARRQGAKWFEDQEWTVSLCSHDPENYHHDGLTVDNDLWTGLMLSFHYNHEESDKEFMENVGDWAIANGYREKDWRGAGDKEFIKVTKEATNEG
jgi:hypothetical protein